MRTVVVLALLVCVCVTSAAVPLCTLSDYLSAYTECRHSENRRDLIYYLNPASNCTGGVPTPRPILGLACDITCQGGWFLPMGATACSECGTGEFSLGGGLRIADWSGFPALTNFPDITFRTYAMTTPTTTSIPSVLIPNAGWFASSSKDYIRSGRINASSATILELPVHNLVDGSVSFTYTVDAEPRWDGLVFEVDGVVALAKVSSVVEAAKFSYDLSKGYHSLVWKFSKDMSVSMGEDLAVIKVLELRGIEYAESFCTKCSPGTANPSAHQSTCTSCARNTFSNSTGASSCSPCSAGMYSLEGATACITRPVCTDNDYSWYYTPCELRNGTPRRDRIYQWLSSTICNYESSSAVLPANELNLECGACNAGQFRAPGTTSCSWCDSGKTSSAGATSCSSCNAGQASIPGLYYTNWDEWASLPGFTTSCSGSCGTTGWALSGTNIFTGLGHGKEVDVSLSLDVTLEQASSVTFGYSVGCTTYGECKLQFIDAGVTSSSYTSGTSRTASVALAAGNHTLTWIFQKRNSAVLKTTDKVSLTSILIPSARTTLGGKWGGQQCTDCTAGSYSHTESAFCSLCDAGYSSKAKADSCTICPANTYNPARGGLCLDCGSGVTSQPGSLICETNCSYSPDGGLTLYDVSSLRRSDMYGPVFDQYGQQYWVNLCTRYHSNVTCVDSDGTSINTLACQVTAICPNGRCVGKSLGDVVGYTPYVSATGQEGFVLSYTGGTVGCGNTPRSTNITFLCKPGAGVGSPTKPKDRLIEGPGCHYELIWESEYGCQVCTSKHYSYYLSSCENNKRTKTYYWLDNPKRCHDGVSLPGNEILQVNCSSTSLCSAGQRAEATTQRCVDCEAGTYSAGSGVTYNSFDSVPAIFSTGCEGTGCTAFTAKGTRLVSGTGKLSRLQYATQWVASGPVSFTYTTLVSSASSSDLYFEFLVDNVVKLHVATTTLEPQTFTTTLSAGGHVISWVFSGATSSEIQSVGFSVVKLHSISIIGNQYAPFTCETCWAGSIQASKKSTTCTACPLNTHSYRNNCSACLSSEYSLDGTYCVSKPACTAASWQAQYSACDPNGLMRNMTWSLLAPVICTGGYTPSPLVSRVPCAPCPTGTVRSAATSGLCTVCPTGTWRNITTGLCSAVPQGHVARKYMSFFSPSSSFDMNQAGSWPAGWSTECHGLCSGLPGWRRRTDSLDSGAFGLGSVTSVLKYNPSTGLVSDGSVTFDYKDLSGSDSGLLFFANGQRIALSSSSSSADWQTITVPLARGALELQWIVVQRFSSSGVHDPQSQVRSVVIRGLTSGADEVIRCAAGHQANSQYCEPCPKGTANDVDGGVCSPCTDGFFSDTIGATNCLACYAGTTSQYKTRSARCVVPSCTFSSGNSSVFDLSEIGDDVVGPVADLDGLYYFSVCRGEFNHTCVNSGESVSQLHACQVTKSGWTSFGRRVRFAPSAAAVGSGFTLFFTSGTVTTDCPAGHETSVAFKCDVTAGKGAPVSLGATSSCSSLFLWTTVAACPICTREDYDEVSGACSGSKKSMQLVKRAQCNGPATITEDAVACSNISVPLGVVGGAVAVAAILVAIIIFVVWKNRKMSVRYSKLLSEHPMEMGDFDQQLPSETSSKE